MLETMVCIVTATIHKWCSLYSILICSPYQQWQQSRQEHHRRWDPLWAFWPSPLLSLCPFPTHYHHRQFLSSQKNKCVLNYGKRSLMKLFVPISVTQFKVLNKSIYTVQCPISELRWAQTTKRLPDIISQTSGCSSPYWLMELLDYLMLHFNRLKELVVDSKISNINVLKSSKF